MKATIWSYLHFEMWVFSRSRMEAGTWEAGYSGGRSNNRPTFVHSFIYAVISTDKFSMPNVCQTRIFYIRHLAFFATRHWLLPSNHLGFPSCAQPWRGSKHDTGAGRRPDVWPNVGQLDSVSQGSAVRQEEEQWLVLRSRRIQFRSQMQVARTI